PKTGSAVGTGILTMLGIGSIGAGVLLRKKRRK
ncbi:LPXTG cell wall anchor domain-containing protein, partial [Clostridium perfringens]|nr:LPXTG cell wall anchor domain-containing protein [Clostridium perfringens]